jgi:hypothetical protein
MVDFSYRMAGCSIFNKIVLDKDYHQIPPHPADVPKTAIKHVTSFCLFENLPVSLGCRRQGMPSKA